MNRDLQTPCVTWLCTPPADLPTHTIDIWRTSLEGLANTDIDWRAYLSASETARAERFKFKADQQRYRICHTVLRHLLGHYLGQPRYASEFQVGEFGKPMLSTNQLHFNLSHTKQWCLIAIAADAPVGVDVETVDPDFDGRRLAAHYFNPDELAQIDTAHDEIQACETFFSLWTCKEALLKADGRGLHLPLTSFSVTAPLQSSIARTNQLPYKLQRFQVVPDHLGAVATSVTTQHTRFFDVPTALLAD